LTPFTNLPPQTPINLKADAYGRIALDLSRLAAMTTRCELDVAYGDVPHRKLDIYLPEKGAKGPFPVFVNLHGGGHKWGYKEWMGLNAPVITRFPAIYISVEYALATSGAVTPYFKIPDQLEDTATAVAWVYKNIAKYGGDPERIHIGGHSAGARLSSLFAVRSDVIARHGLPANVVKSCFPQSGSYDSRDVAVYGDDPGKSDRSVSDPEFATRISPIANVAATKTPFFLIWGENDNAMAKASGPAMILALRGAGARAHGHMFPLFDHFWIHVAQQEETNLWTRTLRSWMLADPLTAPVPTV
jgi:arylformamidase